MSLVELPTPAAELRGPSTEHYNEIPVSDPQDSDDVSSEDPSFADDQDGAQAVLQPAMSAAASHLTSSQTPATERVAALEKRPTQKGRLSGNGSLPGSVPDSPGFPQDGDSSGRESPDAELFPKVQPSMPGRKPAAAPTPWTASPQQSFQVTRSPSPVRHGSGDPAVKETRSQQTKGLLGSAFGQTRQQRSRSAGQEALKRLTKAFSSRPSSFLSSLSDKSPFASSAKAEDSPLQSSSSGLTLQNNTLSDTATPKDSPSQQSIGSDLPPLASESLTSANKSSSVSQRPKALRRVTSDEDILYYNLSRASSLGDDTQFTDVREMVNMRLMAIKESLPDVPNFKMPSLVKIPPASKWAPTSLNGIFSSSEATKSTMTLDREPSTASKDGAALFDRVLEDLTGDIVIMGGYRGSILRSAEPPHHQLWAPVKVGLNIRKANFELGLDDEDELDTEKTIFPSGMIQNIGPVDMSRKFFKRLRSCENARNGKLRIWDYGYDWRLSPHLLSRRLQDFLMSLPSNQPGVPPESRGALVIAHSLGGLITRHCVNQQPDLFSGVLYAGTPQRCVNILGPFRNGDVVLFNEKLLTAQVNFSIRTTFVFLPEDGFCFVDKNTGEEYPVDFYDPNDWVKWRFSPCVQPPLPPFNRPQSSSLSSFFPNSLRARADSKTEKRHSDHGLSFKDRTIAPQMNSGTTPSQVATSITPPTLPSLGADPESQRNFEYLTRTLAATKKFRAELSHRPDHQTANAYPPMAVLYGKTIPTVYAAQVNGRDAIGCVDAYDDLLFRSGDGVVLAKEAMLPEGYSIVRGGRVSTERGHITMLGDLPAMGKVLEALVRGRRKGIGMGSALEKAQGAVQQ